MAQQRIAANELQRYLQGVSYPANKQALMERARENGAPDEVLQMIRTMQKDQFNGSSDVMEAYGEEGR